MSRLDKILKSKSYKCSHVFKIFFVKQNRLIKFRITQGNQRIKSTSMLYVLLVVLGVLRNVCISSLIQDMQHQATQSRSKLKNTIKIQTQTKKIKQKNKKK